MQPGPELDALVLSKVFGKSVGQVGWLQSYSTDIRAAWEVVEKLRSSRPEYILLWPQTSPGGNCRCVVTFGVYRETYKDFMEKGYDEIIGDTAPHAICLAALKAVGVEI